MQSEKGHIHILGIAGHAMRGVAYAAKQLGYAVTGTDEMAYPPGTDWLAKKGIRLWAEPDADHLNGVSLLVVGGGVSADHPELIEANKRGISVKSYPELVSELIKPGARRIVVTGTHGKTTTTAFLAWIFESAGRKPDFLIGMQPNNFDSSVRLGGSDVVILEGDEYRSSRLDQSSKFAHYKPDVATITSIEMDHPDMFADIESISQRFEQMVEYLPTNGHLYYWNGSDRANTVALLSSAPTSSYGDDGDYQAKQIEFDGSGISFDLTKNNQSVGHLTAPLYGRHNVLNSLAAAAVALGEGVSFSQLQHAMASFRGASRRFERISNEGASVTVIDDYAHHPTEVATTIEAAKLHFTNSLHHSGRVIAVFRPHTYSRTLKLLNEYKKAFAKAELAYIGPIEGARESSLEANVSGADIAVEPNINYQEDRHKLVESIVASAKPGDVVLCMSVNGYENLAQELAEKLALK